MADLEPCPHCGRDDFGNAGARTQHVRSCAEQAKKYQQNGGGGTQQTQQQAQAKQPTIEPADEQQQTTPAPTDDLASAGETMANGLSSALDEDAPLEQRKSGIKKLGELVTGAVSGVMEHRERKAQQEEQRARGSDLQPVEDKPNCECGLTFSKIPANADRISCPECGREYQVR